MRHAWSHNGIELKERYAVPGVRGHVRTPTLFTLGQAWQCTELNWKRGMPYLESEGTSGRQALFSVGQAWLYRTELKEGYAVPGVRGHVRTPTLLAVGQAVQNWTEREVCRTWSQGARQDAGPAHRRPGLAIQNWTEKRYAVPGVRGHVRTPSPVRRTPGLVLQNWTEKERYAVPGVRGHVRTPTLFAVGQVRPDGDDSQLVLVHGLQ